MNLVYQNLHTVQNTVVGVSLNATLANPKSHFKFTVSISQYILWLQITMINISCNHINMNVSVLVLLEDLATDMSAQLLDNGGQEIIV